MTALCIGAYFALWVAAAAFLAGLPGGSFVEPAFVLALLGVAFPALALAATRRSRPAPDPVTRPRAESIATLAYLAVFSAIVLGPGLSWLRDHIAPVRTRELLTLAVKLVTMCLAPAALLRALGSRALPPGSLRPRSSDLLPGIVVGLALLVFQAVFGRGLREMEEVHASVATLAWAVPASFAWLILEAGATEELLFRAALQTRLAASLRSDVAAVFVASALFGLAHAPGLYLRGGHLAEGLVGAPTPAWATAYSIAIVSPAGLLFGVLWWRTRSFALVVLLHGWGDLLPNLARFIRTWAG